MSSGKQLPRRTFLRGLGAAVALPMLDCMRPAVSLARTTKPAPKRMAFIYIPNGVHMPAWTPEAEGTEFALPATLEPLAPVKSQLLVLTGLAHDKARPHGDGPGDHARAAAAFLTGVHPRKTHGADIQAGVSVDQIAARHLADVTPYASLELGCDRGMNSGNCDSGYSCAYSANISWRTPSTPMAKEHNPRAVFERIFGKDLSPEARAARMRRDRYRRSILDLVAEDTRSLMSRLGPKDRRKLDEYLYAVRDIEKRIERSERLAALERPEMPKPEGIPRDYGEHIRLMYDLQVLAFQSDVTRVTTFMVANEGSNRSYRMIEVPEGHHHLSHHGGDAEKQAKIAKINRFHVEQLAHFVRRLQEIEEGDGTLLDQSMIVYGSGIGDGNRHNHDDLPVLLIGRGGGAIRSGRHVRYPKETPMTNLFLSMLDIFGVQTDTLGDATGRLNYLTDVTS